MSIVADKERDLKTLTKQDVFDKIFQPSIYGNLGLFVGAGFSKAVIKKKINAPLGWLELIKKVCEIKDIDFPNDDDIIGKALPVVATEICMKLAKKEDKQYDEAKLEFKREICKIVNWLPEEEVLKIYRDYFNIFDPSWIITTNYDLILESIMTGKCKSVNPREYITTRKGIIPIYHLHGTRVDPNSIIITQEDYIPLFRPSEYRQSKLAMMVRESTTLVLGYGLGDTNVLTALDWSKNVYTSENEYPHSIIQILYSEVPNEMPYMDYTGNIVIETNSLEKFLKELTDYISLETEKHNKKMDKLTEYINFLNPENEKNEEVKNKFINEQKHRLATINVLNQFESNMIEPYINFVVDCLELANENSSVNGNFESYDMQIKIVLDLLINYEPKNMPPRLLKVLADRLDRILYYVGDGENLTYGDSWKASRTWKDNKRKIPLETRTDLITYAENNLLSKLFSKVSEI